MSDRALENATSSRQSLQDRKRELLAELASIDDRLGQIERFVKDWHYFAEDGVEQNANTQPVDNSTQGVEPEREARPTRRNSSKEDVAATAREIILERGEPVSRKDLFRTLVDRGFIIQGKDPDMVLSTMLWRMRDQIVRVKGGGYWPADIPHPPSGYDPATATVIDNILNTPAVEIRDPITFEPSEFEVADLPTLEEVIASHDRAYYAEDTPAVSDAQYDALRARLGELKAEAKEINADDSFGP